jgi:hypothetical protein
MVKIKKKGDDLSGAKLGHWIFLAGIIIAIIAGLIMGSNETNATIILVLAVLGLIVGLINITLRDEVPFLVAATVLLIASGTFAQSLMGLPFEIGLKIASILGYVIVFVAPASLVVALKAIYAFARA